MVRYLKRRSKFSKESSLTGNGSDKIFQIHSINSAHPFKPMHTYALSELGTNKPSADLPSIREDFLKKSTDKSKRQIHRRKSIGQERKQGFGKVVGLQSSYVGTKECNTSTSNSKSMEGSQRLIDQSNPTN